MDLYYLRYIIYPLFNIQATELLDINVAFLEIQSASQRFVLSIVQRASDFSNS